MKLGFAAVAAILTMTTSAFAAGQSIQTAAGPAYVNGNGMTLYMLSRDQPQTSTCYRKCAQVWPPYLVRGYAMSGAGWSIIARNDGTRMWAYRGFPVYTFFKDKKPGDARGNGVSDRWGHWRVALVGGGRYVTKKVRDYPPRQKLDYGATGSVSSGGGSMGGGGY